MAGHHLAGKAEFPGLGTRFHSGHPRGPWAATFTPAAFPLAELSSEHPTPHGPRPLSSGYSPQAGHASRTHPTGGARGRETATRPGPPPPPNPSTEFGGLRLRLTPRPIGALAANQNKKRSWPRTRMGCGACARPGQRWGRGGEGESVRNLNWRRRGGSV